MPGRYRRGAAALAAGVSLVAAACGGDDDGGGGGAETVNTIDQSINQALQSTTTADDATATTATAREEPTSIEEWEELWAEERATIVERIKENGWGLQADGKTITGPEGFSIDLAACAAGWSNTEGLTDTEFKIGQSIAQSGTLADYGNYGKAIDVLLKYYGDQGAFKDSEGKTRKPVYLQKDDGYDPARAIPNVDELLDSEKVFAIWTLGTPATMKTYDKINERCLPHLLAMTGHPAWGDPVNHPWTTGAPVPSYTTETQLWGTFIEQNLDQFEGDKVVVAALVMNNDFGKVYDAGFRAFLAQSELLKDKVEFVTESIEPSAPTITDPMTTLASKNPDVFIAMTAGTSCTQTVTEAAQNGMKENVKFLFQPLTCSGTGFVAKEKVGGDGSAANGWWIFNPGVKDLKDPNMQDDVWTVFARDLLADNGIDPDSSSLLSGGFSYAWPFVQTLLIAQELDGGLTRANVIVAHRSIDMTPPTHDWGIRSVMNGNKDSYINEGGSFAKFDSVNQKWVVEGQLYDLNGKSSNCAWDQSVSACK
ncbi:ABC transporter substrate-binding protein [Nocardioides sp.]|uniref:ABC transporter substrate-binding protein n=1 Tax=Nocardioides sp. TaxID=35761 RepID=UPI003D0D7DD6